MGLEPFDIVEDFKELWRLGRTAFQEYESLWRELGPTFTCFLQIANVLPRILINIMWAALWSFLPCILTSSSYHTAIIITPNKTECQCWLRSVMYRQFQENKYLWRSWNTHVLSQTDRHRLNLFPMPCFPRCPAKDGNLTPQQQTLKSLCKDESKDIFDSSGWTNNLMLSMVQFSCI